MWLSISPRQNSRVKFDLSVWTIQVVVVGIPDWIVSYENEVHIEPEEIRNGHGEVCYHVTWQVLRITYPPERHVDFTWFLSNRLQSPASWYSPHLYIVIIPHPPTLSPTNTLTHTHPHSPTPSPTRSPTHTLTQLHPHPTTPSPNHTLTHQHPRPPTPMS